MISHRLGAARSHDELVTKGGEYAKLFATQAQWYQ